MTHAVTGAFGYSGRAVARLLLERGIPVRNLTGHPSRPDPFGGRVEVAPLQFDDPAALRASLAGVSVLVNTWWIRFARGRTTHALAVERSRALFAAARDAGVRRIVHVSITNPSPTSRLAYFRGKAEVEEALRATGVPHSILRPAVLFGARDVLVNNIAWVARRLPVIAIPRGEFGVQPIHVDDFARLLVAHASERGCHVLDAVGPEAPSYRDLVAGIARAVGARPRIVAVPRWAVHLGARALGLVTRDVVLTRDEVDGLAENLLVSSAPPKGTTRLTEWLAREADTLGRTWASELGRQYR
jgi:NADH dehydrogenase